MSQYMIINPTKEIHGGECNIPSSKPETQRALIVAALASGKSHIHNPLKCLETDTMVKALQSIGSSVTEYSSYWEIQGNGNSIIYKNKTIQCLGSGLVFRTLSALACFSKTPVVITGDSSLRPRVMAPLFDSLRILGANIEHLADENKAPIVNWGGGISSGECILPGNISSQFITSIMFAAPFTNNGIVIKIEDEILSKSYIRQTIHYMRLAGIFVTHTDSLDNITVYHGEYKPIDTNISGDMTSASYLVLIACLYKGEYIFHNANSISLQGEKYFFEIAKALGVEIIFDDDKNTVRVINHNHTLRGEYQFNVSDCPNIIPTLAALGAYVEGSFTISGGSITTQHKCNRIEAMITELTKLGVNIIPIVKNNIYDGFTIHGKAIYEGGVNLSSWGDHRIFMSLYIVSLKMNNPNKIDGYADVICSFPTFFDEIDKLNKVRSDIKKQELLLTYNKSLARPLKYNITPEVQ